METQSDSAAPKKSVLKWVVGGVLGLLLVAVAAIALVLRGIDPHEYLGKATAAVKEKTGRDLGLAGAVNLRILPSPEIIAENVTFSNAPWGSRAEMIRVRRLEIEIALLPLFHGEVSVARLVLVEPDVLLEVEEKGRSNWKFDEAAKREAAPDDGAPPALRIGALRIEKGKLAYVDRRSKKRTELDLERADAKRRNPLTSDLDVDIAGTLDAKPFGLKGSIGDPNAILADRSMALDLAGQVPGATMKVAGRIEHPRSAQGFDAKLELDVANSRSAAGFFGGYAPALPPLKVNAQVRDRDGGQTVDPLQVTLGKSQLSGSVRVERKGPRPKVTGKLAGPLVDLSQIAPEKPQPKQPRERSDGRVFSADPLPFAALKAADADAELKIDKLILPGGDVIQALQLKVSLDSGRLKADPASFTAGGGRVSARLDLDASSGKSANLNLHAEGSGLKFGTLIAMTGRPQRMSGGPTDFRVDASGAGASVRTLMASLNGSARITVGEARIEGSGLDLGADVLTQAADALNPGRRANAQRLQCLVVNVPVRNGVVTLDNRVGAETDQVGMLLEGTVNLGTEALDLAARSKAKQGIATGLANFSGVARIEGTFANPRLGVDARGAAEAAATVGAAVSTGGMSLLYQSLFNKAFPDHPCQEALAAGTAPAAGRKSEAAPAKKKEPGFFDRLFGK